MHDLKTLFHKAARHYSIIVHDFIDKSEVVFVNLYISLFLLYKKMGAFRGFKSL